MSDVVADTTTAVSTTYGSLGQLEVDRQSLISLVSDTISDIGNVNAVIEGQAEYLVTAYGPDSDPPLAIANGNVSVLAWGNDPSVIEIAPQNDAYACALCAVLVEIFETLGDQQTANYLTQRSTQAANPWAPDTFANPWSRP